MVINAGMASGPVDIRRARFSWHFHTLGRRRWLLVQFVSAPHAPEMDDELTPPRYTQRDEAPAPARLLDNFTGEIWRRRSF